MQHVSCVVFFPGQLGGPPTVCSDELSCSTEMHTFTACFGLQQIPAATRLHGIKFCKFIETCCGPAHFYPAKDYPEETTSRQDNLATLCSAGRAQTLLQDSSVPLSLKALRGFVQNNLQVPSGKDSCNSSSFNSTGTFKLTSMCGTTSPLASLGTPGATFLA